MLRITPLQEDNRVARLRVEGRVTHQTVAALRSSCEEGLVNHPTLLLELSGVQFVDAAGIAAFRGLAQRGTVLVGCSGFLTELLQLPDAGGGTAPESAQAEGEAREGHLLARLRRGEEGAFEQLVRQYSSRLLAVARRLLGSEHEAHDAVQEAFLSAFKAIGQFTGTAKLSTWLHRIVVNAALIKLRSRRRKPEESIDELLPRFNERGEWSSHVPPWETSSERLLQQRETRALVRRCIDRLPDTYRTVLLLRDIDDLNTEEVAGALGITPNAVKIRLHRARQALRTLLERELIGPSRRQDPR